MRLLLLFIYSTKSDEIVRWLSTAQFSTEKAVTKMCVALLFVLNTFPIEYQLQKEIRPCAGQNSFYTGFLQTITGTCDVGLILGRMTGGKECMALLHRVDLSGLHIQCSKLNLNLA